MVSRFRNTVLLKPGTPALFGADIRIEADGRIVQIGAGPASLDGDKVVDATGALCLPGQSAGAPKCH